MKTVKDKLQRFIWTKPESVLGPKLYMQNTCQSFYDS